MVVCWFSAAQTQVSPLLALPKLYTALFSDQLPKLVPAYTCLMLQAVYVPVIVL
jgi:hypothetical protein